jgi:hypothetical protein
MKKSFFLTLLLSSGLLFGCSSTQPLSTVDFEQYSGGERVGDVISLFWYTESQDLPHSASDFVQSDWDGWYQTSYRWQGKVLREIVREGTQRSGKGLVPFHTHLRFGKNGEAVYQQYRVDGKVFPLTADALEHYKNQAIAIIGTVKKQDKQGTELIQGVWNGQQFETCSGHDYAKVEFNQTLPGFVIHRLASLDNYIAFLGYIRNNRVYVQEILILADDDHDCIDRPQLIEEPS